MKSDVSNATVACELDDLLDNLDALVAKIDRCLKYSGEEDIYEEAIVEWLGELVDIVDRGIDSYRLGPRDTVKRLVDKWKDENGED